MLNSILSRAEVLDSYFLETRAKLLEIAATLDRLDRVGGGEDGSHDRRITFMREALKVLEGSAPNRAELIQRLYSNE